MKGELFKLPMWPWVALFGVLSLAGAVVLVLAGGIGALIPSLVIGSALFAFVIWAGQLSVGPDGMTMYRVNRMRWDNALSARLTTLLGLPYLQVRRIRGLTWSVPLYFVGRRDLRDALIEYAPQGNPIRECFAPNKPLQPTRATLPNEQRAPAGNGPRG